MYNIEKFITEEQISERIKLLSEEINEYYKGKEILIICLLKGALVFTSDLIRKLNVPVELDFIRASSYNDKTYSQGKVDILDDIKLEIKGKNVLIIDDIIDTGYTLKEIIDHLKERAAKTISICTLFDKPARRKTDITVDFVGFEIEDEFIIGYGLDYNQKYRNLPYIGRLKDDNY